MPAPKVTSSEDDGGINELHWEPALKGTKLVTVKKCSMPCLLPGPCDNCEHIRFDCPYPVLSRQGSFPTLIYRKTSGLVGQPKTDNLCSQENHQDDHREAYSNHLGRGLVCHFHWYRGHLDYIFCSNLPFSGLWSCWWLAFTLSV